MGVVRGCIVLSTVRVIRGSSPCGGTSLPAYERLPFRLSLARPAPQVSNVRFAHSVDAPACDPAAQPSRVGEVGTCSPAKGSAH